MIGLLHEHLAHEVSAEALRARPARPVRRRRRFVLAPLALAAWLLIAGPAHASSTDPVTFAPHADSAVGSQAFSVTAGDFDRDGHPDAVTADINGDVNIARGLGNGVFAAPFSSPSGANSLGRVAVGDFNGDGKLDVAANSRDLGGVGVWIGAGDGTASGPAYYSTGSGTSDVKAADLNGDGKLDLVAANFYSKTVTVLVGVGDGTFVTDGYYNTLSYPTSVAVGDVDGDGKVDVAVGVAGTFSVSVFHGVGDASLGPRTDRRTSDYPRSVVIADFNGDGQGDVAAATSGPVTVFISEHGDLPQQGVNYTGAGPSDTVAAGDLNGDGLPDLAVVSPGEDVVSVWLANGDGTFATPRLDFPTATRHGGLALADLDGDGRLDLLTAGADVVSGLLNTTTLSPGVATGPASDVTQTRVTVTGAINPRGRRTMYRYEYGSSASYGQSTPWYDAGAADSPVPAPAAIDSLQPGTEYHYRLIAVNARGQAEGQDATFTTASAPPPSADLALSIGGPSSVEDGDEISYRLTVANNGPDAATGVVVTDPLPDGARFVASKSSPSCTEAAETVTCQVGSLANGGQVAIDIVVAPARSGRLANTAYVTATEPDRDTSNGNATARTTVEAAPAAAGPAAVQPQPQSDGQPQEQQQQPSGQPSAGRPDLKRPTLSLRIPARISKRQALRGFRIAAGCDERCSLRFDVKRVRAGASLAIGDGVRGVTVRPCATGSRAARSKCRATLRSSLGRVRSLRTKVTIVAVDASGNKTTQSRTITIR